MDKDARAVVLERVTRFLEDSVHSIDTQTYDQLFRATVEMLDDIGKTYEEVSELERVTYEKRNYECANELNGFDIGACWGCMKVLEAAMRRSSEEGYRAECLAKAKQYSELLVIVRENPDITQGKLAKEMGTSPSSLSQTLSRLAPYRLLLTTVNGRSKHYSISPLAKELMGEFETPEEVTSDQRLKTDGNDSTEYRISRAEVSAGQNDPKGASDYEAGDWHNDRPIDNGGSGRRMSKKRSKGNRGNAHRQSRLDGIQPSEAFSNSNSEKVA